MDGKHRYVVHIVACDNVMISYFNGFFLTEKEANDFWLKHGRFEEGAIVEPIVFNGRQIINGDAVNPVYLRAHYIQDPVYRVIDEDNSDDSENDDFETFEEAKERIDILIRSDHSMQYRRYSENHETYAFLLRESPFTLVRVSVVPRPSVEK